MRRSMPLHHILALAMLTVSAFPHAVQAREDDGQFWLFLNGVMPIDENLAATLEFSPRLRDNSDQLLLRGSIDMRLAPNVDLGGGIAWVESAGGQEFRPHQQVHLTFGQVQLRTRIEQRFFQGTDRPQLRLRQRVQVTVPVAENLRVAGNAELLYIAQQERRTRAPAIDSWRFNIAASYRLSPHLDLSAGYLAIYVPRDGAEDRLSHVPQVRVTLR